MSNVFGFLASTTRIRNTNVPVKEIEELELYLPEF